MYHAPFVIGKLVTHDCCLRLEPAGFHASTSDGLGGSGRRSSGRGTSRFDPTETLPIDYCALRVPDLYAILYEERRVLYLARAEEDDSIVRCAQRRRS
jgi:hypothetical protein